MPYDDDDNVRAKIKEDGRRARDAQERAAAANSETGQAIAWWENFKQALAGAGYPMNSNENRMRLGYYAMDPQTKSMDEFSINGHNYRDIDNLDDAESLGSFEEPSPSQLVELKKASDEGRLVLFKPSQYGDKSQIISYDDKNGISYLDTKQADANAITAKPVKPASVGFFTRVRSFFGNKQAKETVNKYNEDLAKYNQEKAAYDKLAAGKSEKEIQKALNANAINKRVNEDLKRVAADYREATGAQKTQSQNQNITNEKQKEIEPEVKPEVKVEKPQEPKKVSASEYLETMQNKYANFDVKSVKDFDGVMEIHKDIANLCKLSNASNLSANTQKQFAAQANAIMGIQADNKEYFKDITSKFTPQQQQERMKVITHIQNNVKTFQQRNNPQLQTRQKGMGVPE